MNDGNEVLTPPAPTGPATEENGPWFAVAVISIVVLFALAGAAVVHALAATFA